MKRSCLYARDWYDHLCVLLVGVSTLQCPAVVLFKLNASKFLFKCIGQFLVPIETGMDKCYRTSYLVGNKKPRTSVQAHIRDQKKKDTVFDGRRLTRRTKAC